MTLDLAASACVATDRALPGLSGRGLAGLEPRETRPSGRCLVEQSPDPGAHRPGCAEPRSSRPGPCPVIRTPRLKLRPHVAADADAIAASLADFAVSRMLLRVPQPYHLADAREWLQTDADDGHAWNAAITEGDGLYRGMVSIEWRPTGWHLGYWLNRQAWGRGLMVEAAGALLEAFFRDRPDEAVQSGVFADNTASLKVQAKLGFAITGIRDVYVPARAATVNRIETRLTRADLLHAA